MAKVKAMPDTRASLRMNIFGPGMSLLHRAGLGGLACTLRCIERAYAKGDLEGENVPGGPWKDKKPSWTITPTTITLEFEKPEGAGQFFQRLFALAFSLRDGLIFLPGQYDEGNTPTLAIRAELQQALLLTFLQHGKTRVLAKEPVTVQDEIDGQTLPAVEYRKCSSYRHQDGWEELAPSGSLATGPIEVTGPLNPGAIVRHVAFASDTCIEETPERVLPLYFAIVGCLALSVNRGVGVLLVPEVVDLERFAVTRPLMTPTRPQDCRIASAGDAALQAQVRVRAKGHIARCGDLPGVYAMTFTPTPWASQQKSRVATIHVPPGEERRLERFELALAELPPRVKSYVSREKAGSGKRSRVIETTQYFWTDSVVRSLVADNLAADRPWCARFSRKMTEIDQNNRPVRDRISFERKGLHTMSQNPTMYGAEGEALVVKAVHEAIRQSLGRIREETDGKNAKTLSQATKNRWERFREKLRLDLAGAKTEAQVRFALTDLFSRGGNNSVLRESWTKILPVLRDDWTLARDLGLLALASYAGKSASDQDPAENSKSHSGEHV